MTHPLVYLILMLGGIIESLFSLYTALLLLYIILQWLVQLQVINPYKPLFRQVTFARIIAFLARLYEPPLSAIRKRIPPLGSLDLSPIVLFLLANFAGYTVAYIFRSLAGLVQGLLG